MQVIFLWLKRVLLSTAFLLLANCATITSENTSQKTRFVTSPYSMPATAYLALAKQHSGEEQQALFIMAAGRLIQDGSWQQAQAILSQINPSSAALLDEKKILQAKISRIRNKPRDSIALLAELHAVNTLPSYYQAQFHELLATAYASQNNPVESVNERIKLDALLTDENSRSNNLRALWLTLSTIPSYELDVLSIESKENPNIHAWMQLAFIASQQPNSPKHLLSALRHWQATYPNHPGNRLLPQTFETIAADLIDPPHHIALLLPLTGTLAGPGLAIKDGFLAAFNAEPPRQKTLITLYDTNRTPADTCYEQALQDGADFIIGPLTKADVARVASLEHPVPTVLLNEVRTSLGNNIYQFGLSPRLEAYQVAAAARKQGFSHALVMTPADEWGHDIANAFSSQWQDYGGETQDTITFSSLPDINQDVRRALHIDASELRERQIRQLLGHSIESTPQRRQDFDVIFLVAYPTAARQIKPLLNYYNAGNIPVFATSSIYSGTPDTSKDRDLNGIIFSDMPWVLTHQLDHKNWPEQYNSYNRLYALGLDSFALTSALNQLLLFPAIQSQNGALYLGKNQQITRIPAFAQFKEGVPDVINGE